MLRDVVNATPTAELEPITDVYTQQDEIDMGMTYAGFSSSIPFYLYFHRTLAPIEIHFIFFFPLLFSIELSRFGSLRKIERCGPVTMFEKLLLEWNHLKPSQVAGIHRILCSQLVC